MKEEEKKKPTVVVDIDAGLEDSAHRALGIIRKHAATLRVLPTDQRDFAEDLCQAIEQQVYTVGTIINALRHGTAPDLEPDQTGGHEAHVIHYNKPLREMAAPIPVKRSSDFHGDGIIEVADGIKSFTAISAVGGLRDPMINDLCKAVEELIETYGGRLSSDGRAGSLWLNAEAALYQVREYSREASHKPTETPKEPEPLHRCNGCNHAWIESELVSLASDWWREMTNVVAPGSTITVPSGACWKCGGACYPADSVEDAPEEESQPADNEPPTEPLTIGWPIRVEHWDDHQRPHCSWIMDAHDRYLFKLVLHHSEDKLVPESLLVTFAEHLCRLYNRHTETGGTM